MHSTAQLSLLVACLFLLLHISPVISVSYRVRVKIKPRHQVTFTTNATSVQTGHFFTARCHVADYEAQEDKKLIFGFFRRDEFDEKLIECSSTVDDESGQRQLSLGHYNRTKYLAIDLHSNATNYPSCEVNISPTEPGYEYEYYCKFTSDRLQGDYYQSNIETVTVYPAPHLTLTSNVTHFLAGQPFSLICGVEDFVNEPRRNYSVQFRDSTDTLLATYRVFAPTPAKQNGFVMFERTVQEETVVTSGEYISSSTFKVNLNTRIDRNQSYWCTLLDETKQEEYKSNLWPTLNVTFSANVSTHRNGIPFAGRCFVDNFSLTDYSIAFYSAQTGLLATYTEQPKKPIELAIQNHQPNVTVFYGASLQRPTYELSINFTGPIQAFWCALQISENGHMGEFKSNEVTL